MKAAGTELPGAGGRGSQDDDGSPGGAGAAAAGGAPRVGRTLQASGPGGDAGRPGAGLHTFSLRVPFPSPLEADIARGSLAPDAEPHRAAVRKELTVSGGVLAVRWRAEDCRLLRTSVINFLDQLSLVMRTMQRFGPPLSR